jgi:hypothetical protein
MDVAIDTSSLSNVTDDDLVEELAGSILRRRSRLVISGEVLAECLDSNEDGARKRLQTVLRLADTLGTRLVLADELGSIHRASVSAPSAVRLSYREPRWPSASCETPV